MASVTACRIGSTKPAPPPLPMMMFLNPACFAAAAVADPTTKAGFEIHVVASAVLATASTAWRLVKIMPVKSAGLPRSCANEGGKTGAPLITGLAIAGTP